MPGHRNDGLHDGGVVGVVGRVLHKALVDLQLVQGQSLEVGQAGITRAKVVNRETHTVTHKVAHAGNGVVEVFDQQAFGDLQDEQRCRGAGLGKHAEHAFDKIVLAKLALAHVHGYQKLLPCRVQSGQCLAGLQDHPVAHAQDQT